MRRTRLRTTLAVGLAVAALACGSDSDDSAEGEPDETGSASTTEESTTTTTAVGAELCATLGSDLYEIRKSAVDQAEPEELTSAQETCGELVEALEAARSLQDSAATLADHSIPSDFTCQPDPVGPSVRVTVSFTNDTEVDVGVYGRMARQPTDDKSGWFSEPFVAWHLAPGETFDHQADLPRGPSGGNCNMAFFTFLSDTSAADASVPGDAATDPQASDDPSEWLVANFAEMDAAALSGTPEGLAVTEDLRSPDYAEILGQRSEPDPSFGQELGDFEFCRAVATEGSDYVLVEYFRRWDAFEYTDADGAPASAETDEATVIGAFRRGEDGRWRWLGGTVTMHARRCGDPGF